ncbi:MAG: cupin domain-containing protein [Nanoarchaeota archaeon]|nr:cupin domain-containing protein [Nanoarchaeota archaeon]
MIKKFREIKDLIEYPSEGILSKEIVKTEKLDVSLFCMAKGTEISEHTSTKQGFVYVLEGNGIFNLKGEEIKMKPGIFIYMGKNSAHSLKAKENTSFMLSLC